MGAAPPSTRESARQQLLEAIRIHANGNMMEAERVYRQILDRSPEDPDALHYLGICHQQRGDLPEAERLIRKSIEYAPKNASFFSNYGNVLKGLGQIEEAKHAYRKALVLRPDFVDAMNNLGLCLLSEKNHAQALETFNSALALSASDTRLLTNKGKVLVAMSEQVMAEQCLSQALQLNPSYPDALLELGLLKQQAHDTETALQLLSRCCKVMPQNAGAWNALGGTLLSAKLHAEAEAALKNALTLNPDFAEAHNNLGGVYLAQGKRDAAVESFEQAIKIDPAFERNRHLINAIRGETTDRPPAAYVQELFDAYAEKFDTHLTQTLAYRIPSELRELLADNSRPEPESLNILDLGCGTGLSGMAFQDLAKTLTGIDLSEKMLLKARERGIYTNLLQGDLITLLADLPPASFDLVIAADVLVYIGALDSLFPAVSRVLKPVGLFAFSVEALPEGNQSLETTPSRICGFALEKSGRYRHQATYLTGQAAAAGMNSIAIKPSVVRLENGTPLPGWIVLLEKAYSA